MARAWAATPRLGPIALPSDLGPKRTSPELKKLWEYADIKVPMTPGLGPNAKPIPWIRIHKVPEYVHFPHMRHVNAGVTCQTCHGQIQKMSQVYQFASLNMGWCVSCHVNGYSAAEGLEAAGYALPANPVRIRVQKPPQHQVDCRGERRLWFDCANCHY